MSKWKPNSMNKVKIQCKKERRCKRSIILGPNQSETELSMVAPVQVRRNTYGQKGETGWER